MADENQTNENETQTETQSVRMSTADFYRINEQVAKDDSVTDKVAEVARLTGYKPSTIPQKRIALKKICLANKLPMTEFPRGGRGPRENEAEVLEGLKAVAAELATEGDQ